MGGGSTDENGLGGAFAAELTGRDAQRAAIDAALAGIATTGASVILCGDPGTGRTALLGAAEAQARRAGLRVLRMTGAEAESGLPFAALHQVLWPLLDEAEGLPEPQRCALESALGVREGVPPQGFAVAGAALTLLAHAAARRPLVVLLDDLQWADPSSVAVFGYVQRHLAALPVVAIAATRRTGTVTGPDGAAAGPAEHDVTTAETGCLAGEVIDLPPLEVPQAEQLLRTLHPSLPEGVRRRVLRAAAGNPLALHELPEQVRGLAADRAESLASPGRSLEPPQPPELPELFEALPMGERLGRLYEDRLRALPEAARDLLLVAALGDASTRHRTVLRNLAAQAAGPPWHRLEEQIERSGLAHVDPELELLEFHHPLVRASLTHLASPAELRAAHRLLADALPATDTRRTLHLAAAALGTDAELAALLHAEADSMAAQGGDAEATVLMARAAALSPDRPSRTARLVAAAALAVRAGRPHLAAEHIAAAEAAAHPARPEPATPYAFAVAYTRLQLNADPRPAIDLLPAALTALAPRKAAPGTPALRDAASRTPVLPDAAPGASALRDAAGEAPALRDNAPVLPAAALDAPSPRDAAPAAPFPREAATAAPPSPTPTDQPHQHTELLGPLLFLLLVAAALTGDERAWEAVDRHAAHPAAPTGAELCRQAWSGPRPALHDVPRRLRETVAGLPADRETTQAWLLLWAAAAVDSLGEHCALWSAFARRHAYATQTFTDSLRAHDDFLHGNWDTALAAARAGARTSAEHGYALAETLFLQTAGQILAARGDRAGLDALEPMLGARAGERRLRLVTDQLRGMRTRCALGEGHAEEAWLHARDLTPPGAVADRDPWTHLSLVDRVQAAVDSGRAEEARRHLRAVRASGLARVSAHHAFLVTVAEAIAAAAADDDDGGDDDDDDEGKGVDVDRWFAAVYARPDARNWPFPLARAHLAHAVWLRRQHRPEQAATHCRTALAAFTRLDATPWAARATRELAAADADIKAAALAAGHHPLLTAQETRIARLAAQGLTNRQIGARLSLSPRTIGAHLYRIFPKLGITTRAGIARALEGG